MDWMTKAGQLAELASEDTPQVFGFGRRLLFRGRCQPAVFLPFLAALDQHLRDDDRLPAVMASGTRPGGRWCVVTTMDPELADNDWGVLLADAGLRALGFDRLELPDTYYCLLDDEGFQKLVWQSLSVGQAEPELVATLFDAEIL